MEIFIRTRYTIIDTEMQTFGGAGGDERIAFVDTVSLTRIKG